MARDNLFGAPAAAARERPRLRASSTLLERADFVHHFAVRQCTVSVSASATGGAKPARCN
jgi:hypothetical protein